MAKVILYRLVQFPLILAIIYVLTFLLAWVAPGNPFQSGEKNMDPAVEKMLRERFHADSPWQFLAYYPGQVILHGDLGWSMQYREWPVNRIIHDALPVSITLGLFALLIALLVGVGVGTMAAVYRGGVLDWTSLSITLIGISLPSFVTAAVLLVAASMTRGIPVGGWGNVSQVVLPGLALSLAPMAYIARLTRVAMLDVLGSDYVRTARAKGLSRTVVVWKHCLRNAFLPVLSYLGPAAAATLTGSFVIEKVFNIPGLGIHFVNSVLNRDRTMILGVVMVYSVFLLAFNLLVDIAYAWVDPRIELSAEAR
jgi:oligopeptide transport system permease protein